MNAPAPPAPTIARAATVPSAPRKLFVNLPVADLQRSIRFFEGLGFEFNPQFTDATATCMLVGTDAYVMLLTHAKFDSFSTRPRADARRTAGAGYAVAYESRAAVDAIADRALATGGMPSAPPQDHGFMYERSFLDPDGHHWDAFWMDPAAIPGDPEASR
jgi:predicted lactoylglutathione lyase